MTDDELPPLPDPPPEAVERAPRRPYRLYDDAELARLPAPAWLIDGCLPHQGFAILFGEKGTLKTFLALDWACRVQLGMEWHGRRVRAGQVVYVYAEGRTGIGPRLAAWKTWNRYADPLGVLFLPQRVALNDLGDAGALLSAIRDRCGNAPLALIVIDTLNRNMNGNENSSEDMSAFVRGVDLLREATGAACLVIHHKGHGDADRSRGSSVLDAAADTVVFASRDEDRLTLECKKQKDAAEFATLALEVVPAASSLALKASGPTSGTLKGQRLVSLQVLHREYSAENGASFTAWHEATGLGKSSFNNARTWLAANGYVAAAGGRWRVTEAGRLALGPVRSTVGPVVQSVPGSSEVHSPPGVYNTREWTETLDGEAA
jgi:hypothetical protein